MKISKRVERGRSSKDLVNEADVGLTLCSFIGTANLFFTGLVILNLSNLPDIVQLPVVYLVVSAVAFVLAAVIYANISGAPENTAPRVQMMQVANWVSEYPGIYLFLTAIPLVVLGVTDVFLVQATTAIVCYGGLVAYSHSAFSLDHRRYINRLERFFNSLILVVFTFGVYVLAVLQSPYVLPVGIGCMIFILFLSTITFAQEG